MLQGFKLENCTFDFGAPYKINTTTLGRIQEPMKLIADIHLHSHYSRATSKNLNFEHLTKWAQLKGVHIVGTGDIAHPGWLQEMREKLEPAEEGLFRLKKEVSRVNEEVFSSCRGTVRFMLAGEISSIYRKNDKVRKIHNVIFAPSLEAVEKIQAELEKIGNIRSDGRPILGLDSRDLLEIILNIDPECYLIPAHIWTPWFAMLGSKSGFDSVEECFGDLTPHIFALETGLSSDPPMNWRVSALDGYTLISNSDAHSPQKLAREATLFDTELSYPSIFEALKSGNLATFRGTIEFFPEEGKYHCDGHRKCSVRWMPKTTIAHDGLCSVCQKKVTVGVLHRVEELADREEGVQPEKTHPYHSLIPLPEILGEVHSVGVNSKRVRQHYEALLAKLGSELSILQDIPLDEIEAVGGSLLAEGIRRMRSGDVNITGGYDGEYGVIKLFDEQDRVAFTSQLGLFAPEQVQQTEKTKTITQRDKISDESSSSNALGRQDSLAKSQQNATASEDVAPQKELIQENGTPRPDSARLAQPRQLSEKSETYDVEASTFLEGLNLEQREAAQSVDTPLLIVSGPGTGKTRTLTYRIAYLIKKHQIAPESIVTITFTNKAAEEMKQRLDELVGSSLAERVVIKTFHAFAAFLLHEYGSQNDFAICSEVDQRRVIKSACPELGEREVTLFLEQISAAKNQLLMSDAPELVDFAQQLKEKQERDPVCKFGQIYAAYQAALQASQLLDFDDLIPQAVLLLQNEQSERERIQERFRWISVDEYQDTNLGQYHLLRLLVGENVNVCAIGDPDQAIYGFRGANREYFLRFHQDFPATRILHLSQNYRSTQLILDASSQVIAQSEERSDAERVQIWSELLSQTKLEVYEAPTDKAEAEYVVHQKIERMVGGTSYFSLDSGRVDERFDGNRSFADFAVLYRLGAQSHLLVEAFERSGIPYQCVGQRSLYEEKDIEEILAYLWFLHNPQSTLHLEKILASLTTATSEHALAYLATLAAELDCSLWTLLQRHHNLSFFSPTLQKHLATLVPFLHELDDVYRSDQPISTLLQQIEQFLFAQRLAPKSEKREARIEQLVRRAIPFEKQLQPFLESTALQKETDFYDSRADRVSLMTIHASKGLEFPVVFMVGCEEHLLPYEKAKAEAKEEGIEEGEKAVGVEEERRLFYVGMTRAEERLILTHAKTRFLFGERMENKQSRFVNDIENRLKEIQELVQRKEKKSDSLAEKPEIEQLRLFTE